MPLPFSTADRRSTAEHRLDDHAAQADAPLPYETRDSWRRPYRPGPWRVAAAAVLLLVSSFILFSALIVLATGAVTGAALSAAPAGLIIAFATRLLRVGIWVSGTGVRQVGLLYTKTAPWHTVGALRTVQQPVRWLGLPRTVQGQALVIGRTSGEPLRVLLTDRNGDFEGRPEAFRQAADKLVRWGAEHRP